MKLEKREEEKAKKEAGQGENIPDNLITWVFQDDFIPRGKITKDGNYSIISDYLGTPVEAYDEEGKKVWKRNLDIYGRVKTEEALGEKNFNNNVCKQQDDRCSNQYLICQEHSWLIVGQHQTKCYHG